MQIREVESSEGYVKNREEQVSRAVQSRLEHSRVGQIRAG